MDWKTLAFSSHYQTAEAIVATLEAGDIEEAKRGIEELRDAMGRSEKRALESQLVRLMAHIIKWNIQPERRSRSWLLTIRNARREIRKIQREYPALNRGYVESVWDECVGDAIGDARAETGIKINLTALSWAEVFEMEYDF